MSEIKMFIIVPCKKIVGKIKEQSSDFYKVEDPFIIEEVMTQKGLSIIPIPISPSEKGGVILEFSKNHIVVSPFDPPADIINWYTQQTSNLVLPSLGNGIIK